MHLWITWLAALLAAAPPARQPGPARAELSMEQIDARIRRYRTADVVLTVTGASGQPLAGAAVTVEQTAHKFLFGANAFAVTKIAEAKLQEAYRARLTGLFNYSTLPFYWGGYEPAQGKPRQAELRDMALWCRDRGIVTKGHPLCWHNVCPGWLAGMNPQEAFALQLARIDRDVTAFAGVIDVWDVVNEVVAMPGARNAVGAACARLGRGELIRQTFARARKANPRALLILNDYDSSKTFEDALSAALKAGAPIDAVGLQSHYHKGYPGPADPWDTCQRIARHGKPIHWTEATILSGALKTDNDWFTRRPGWDTTPEGEARQARQVEEFYRVLFSHPSVAAITWWDLSDLNAWQGAPAGLLRKDMSPKPAYEALARLIKGQWWTARQTLTSDSSGQVRFRGYLGRYSVWAPGASGVLDLDCPGEAKATVVLKPAPR